jgi:hypothetical protein
VDATAEVMSLNVGGPIGATNLYVVERNEDGKQGCNLTGQTILQVAVSSSAPDVATAILRDDENPSLAENTFDSCADKIRVEVTPLAVGSTTITFLLISNRTNGTFNLDPATFVVNVADLSNSAPVVSVLK